MHRLVVRRCASEAHPAVDAFLTKPVKPSALHDALVTVLAGAGRDGAASAAPRAAVDRRELGERYPLRILLAEDNAVNQKLALRLLERHGLRGRRRRERSSRRSRRSRTVPFDVVLMDVQMPEMDGLEATRRIAAHGAAGPRIVAMTANAMADDREACLAAGMNDYITKPIRVEELAEALARSATARPMSGRHRSRRLEELLDGTGGDPEFVGELIDAYLADAPAHLAADAPWYRRGRRSAPEPSARTR